MSPGSASRLRARLRGWPGGRWTSAAALAAYVSVSFLYFGLPLALQPGRGVIGNGGDTGFFVWAFAWWPHALLEAENPVITREIWAPDGVNLAWATGVPVLALLAAPLTLTLGPVAAYNVVVVLLPALAAWTAFLLFRYLTGKTWPALAGGYLFGFSAYMLGHQQGHPNLTAVFLVPLVALFVLRYLDGELGGKGLVLRLGVLLALQLGLSTELAFTITVALGVALVLAFALAPARRSRLRSLAVPLLGAYALAVVLAAPLLYYALRWFERGSINDPEAYPADLLNVVVPTGLVVLGQVGWLSEVAERFPGNEAEAGSFLGLPVLAIAALYAWRSWRTTGGRFLLASLGLALVAALGTALHVAGEQVVELPYSYVERLPFFNNVLPARYALFASLAAATIVALWAASPGRLWPRVLLPALAVATIVPFLGDSARLGQSYWRTQLALPAFFEDGLYRTCLSEGENVLVIPYGHRGDSMLWQAESDFHFRMAGGYAGPKFPGTYLGAPGFTALVNGWPMSEGELRELARIKGITTVLVVGTGSDAELWNEALPEFISRRLEVGGVSLYALAPGPSASEACRLA